MEKKTEVKASLLDKILAKLGVKTLEEAEQAVAEPQAKAEPKAMELNTADGQTLTVEREEGDPQVGDKASPDGTFEMPDGKTIVVEDGVITDIQTADNTDNDNEGGEGGEGGSASSADNDTVAKLKQQVAALKQQLNETKAQLAGAQKLAKSKEDMRILNAVKMAGGAEKVLAGYSSHYQPAQRQPSGKGAGDNVNAVGGEHMSRGLNFLSQFTSDLLHWFYYHNHKRAKISGLLICFILFFDLHRYGARYTGNQSYIKPYGYIMLIIASTPFILYLMSRLS